MERIYDEVVEIGGEFLKIEQKAWKVDNLRTMLRKHLSITVRSGNKADETGQLLLEMLSFKNNNNKLDMRWDFSAEMAAIGPDGILDEMMDLIKTSDAIKSHIKNTLKLSDDVELEIFLKDFKAKARTTETQRGLFKVEDYKSLLAAQQ